MTMNFWANVKIELKRKGMTQEQLAKASGLSFRTLQGWISKERMPRGDQGAAIARALEVSVERLMTGLWEIAAEEAAEHANAFAESFVAEPSRQYLEPMTVERFVKRQSGLMADLMELGDSELGTIAMMVRPLANQARESKKKSSAG
jgi:transcriptional regulator with XRE-family HTH domain